MRGVAVRSILVPVFAALLGTASLAQDAHTVHFAPGTTGATIKAAITGDSFIDYRLSAKAGQEMDITLSGTAYFNVLPPGSSGEAIFIGANEGEAFSGTLSTSGTYTVRIYQMGAAADEGQTQKFTLDIDIN